MRTNEKGQSLLAEDFKISGDNLYYTSNGEPTLPIGTITIQETKAPEGYLLNPEIFIRQITSDGSAESVNTYNEPVIPETVMKGSVEPVSYTHLVITPENATTKEFELTTDNAEVLKIENGNITALTNGEATVTATAKAGEATATCKVIVNAEAEEAETQNEQATASVSYTHLLEVLYQITNLKIYLFSLMTVQ